MTLNDWLNFNKEVFNIGSMIVTINKSGSYSIDDEILPETLMRNEAAGIMFGDLELKQIRVAEAHEGYHTLHCLLWKKL